MLLRLLACLTVVCATIVPTLAADSAFVPGAFNGTWDVTLRDTSGNGFGFMILDQITNGPALINTLGDPQFNANHCPPSNQKREYYSLVLDDEDSILYGCTNGDVLVVRFLDPSTGETGGLVINSTSTGPPASFSGYGNATLTEQIFISAVYRNGGIATPLAKLPRNFIANDGTVPPGGITLAPGTTQDFTVSVRYQLLTAAGTVQSFLMNGESIVAISAPLGVTASAVEQKSNLTITGAVIPPAASLSLRSELRQNFSILATTETKFNLIQVSPVTAAPSLLQWQRGTGTAPFSDEIELTASGQTPVPFTASVANGGKWLSLATSAGAIQGTFRLGITINPISLAPGFYSDSIRVVTAAKTLAIPVALTITTPAPSLSVDPDGVYFESRQDQGSSVTRRVRLSAQGGSVAWSASVLKGADFIQINPMDGVANLNSPSDIQISLSPDATENLGASYALIEISTPDGKPQHVTVVSNVFAPTEAVVPQLNTASLLFVAVQGAAPPAFQRITVNVSQQNPIAFTTTASTVTGGNWLTAVPSGFTSTFSPGGPNVTVATAGLAPGVYTGTVNITIGNITRTARVILIVQPAGTQMSAQRRAIGCTPTRVVLTEARLPESFSVSTGWPQDLAARLVDDCGTILPGGTVVASFDNGDPPLRLTNDGLTPLYFATWQPLGALLTAVKVRLAGSFGTLTPSVVEIRGNVTLNPKAPPTLVTAGVIHNLNPIVGGPLAPGTVVQIYGRNLAAATEVTSAPLPGFHKGTQIIIDGYSAPFYYVSPEVLVAQLPIELVPGLTYPVVALVNAALSVPISITVVSERPGVATFSGGRVIAQHLDYSLVTDEKPAKPGESLVMYLVGMGATNPPVEAGDFTPLALVPTVVQPEVTIDGAPAQIQYAGLTPTAIGLYQINFVVPPGARSADLDVVITQNGTLANASKLVVRQ